MLRRQVLISAGGCCKPLAADWAFRLRVDWPEVRWEGENEMIGSRASAGDGAGRRAGARRLALGAIAGTLMTLTGGQGVAGAAPGQAAEPIAVVPAPASVRTQDSRFTLQPVQDRRRAGGA